MMFAAVEGGGTKFVCAVANEDGAIIEKTRIDTKEPDETLGEVVAFFRSFPEIRSLGIACFGPLDLNPSSPRWGSITSTPKLAWRNRSIATHLAESLAIPVAIDTDVNGSALGELHHGAGRGLSSLVYITVGTGIGGGLVVNGEPVHGLIHPEVGHMPVRAAAGDGFEGICPYHGNCLEGMASGPAIAARWGKSGAELEADHVGWDFEADYLAQAAATLSFLVSPERIIFGGGVMHARGLIDKLRVRCGEYIAGYLDHARLKSDLSDYIVLPALGDDAGIRGAIMLARRALEST